MKIKIHDLGNYMVRNYILETPRGFIAIDTGYPGGCEKFVFRFQKTAPLNALKYVFLTHAHDDHAGFLSDLLKQCEAKVVLNPLALPILAKGENPVNPGAGYSSRVAALFGIFKKDFAFPPVEPEAHSVLICSEDDQFFERLGLPLRIVALPGHTPDSIGLYLTETKELFCGDAAMNAIISLAKHTIWIDDKERFQASWDKMIAMDISRIYPSHGVPFSPGALIKHRHYLDNRSLIPM